MPMTRKLRILVVDDSVVVRRLLSDALSSDPNLTVVGTAPNGKVALAKIPQVNPDLISLDVDMPEMGGLETLVAIRKLSAKLPVIMFSSLTEYGAAATMNALSLGANDYVTKPAGIDGGVGALQKIKGELIPKVKALCGRAATASPATGPELGNRGGRDAVAGEVRPKDQLVTAVVIGISTGGPNALAALTPGFPADFPAPILIVQHMPPVFTKTLAQRLASLSALPVSEAVAGETVTPGRIWIAPGNFHMELARDGRVVRIQLHQGPAENSCRPAVDVLFRSAAEAYGEGTLAVIMTGMGQDGLIGCRHIRAAGGRIIIQDEASSVVWGMPGAVAKAGLADQVFPLAKLTHEINRAVSRHRHHPSGVRVNSLQSSL